MKDKKGVEKLDWELVQKYIDEKTPAGYGMAVIETDKILSALLDKLGYVAKTVDEKVKLASHAIENKKELLLARKVTQKLKSELNAEITENEAEEILHVYMTSIQALTENEKTARATLKGKLVHRISKQKGALKKTLSRGVIAFFAFFLVVYLLDATNIGRGVAVGLVSVSHFLFSWILFTFLLVAGVLTIILSTFFYFDKRRKKAEASFKSPISSNDPNSKQ